MPTTRAGADRRFRRRPASWRRTADGVVVGAPDGTRRIADVTGVAAVIWELLDEWRTTAELAELVGAATGADPVELAELVPEAVDTLVGSGLVDAAPGAR